jgi:hypothetical protein
LRWLLKDYGLFVQVIMILERRACYESVYWTND